MVAACVDVVLLSCHDLWPYGSIHLLILPGSLSTLSIYVYVGAIG